MTGGVRVGGLAGYADGYDTTTSLTEKATITGYATGKVTVSYYVGGLLVYNSSVKVTGYATVAVTGNFFTGGLTGFNQEKEITSTGYVRGTVTRKTGIETSFGLLAGKMWSGKIL